MLEIVRLRAVLDQREAPALDDGAYCALAAILLAARWCCRWYGVVRRAPVEAEESWERWQ